MKIAILGAGAIGCYYGSRLALAGNDVYFFMRGDRDYVKDHGINVESILGNMRVDNPKLPASTEETGPMDMVLITWKTTSNHQLARLLPPLLKPETLVVSLQNGMGNAEMMKLATKGHKLFCGVCFISSFRTGPGQVKHTANGAISLAPAFSEPELIPDAEFIAATFKKADIPVKVFANSEAVMWNKVIWNVPFNGLSIVRDGADVHEILTSEGGEQLIRDIMQDVMNAAAACGHPLRSDTIDRQIEVTYAMGHYRPSSGIDFLKKRPVEFKSIWMIPYDLAVKAGADLPHWKELNEQLTRKLEQREGT